MKNLLKVIAVALALSIGTETLAQTFGLKAGLNLANMRLEDDGDNLDETKMNPGFHFGPTMNLPINETFSFETAILLSTKGFRLHEKETFLDQTYESKLILNIYYLDIPLTMKARINLGSIKVYGIFGPYIGIGLSGKSKAEFLINGKVEDSYEEEIKFGSDEDIQRLDFGLSLGAGVEFNSIQVGLNYGLGLANLVVDDESIKVNNRVLSISVGYNFNKK